MQDCPLKSAYIQTLECQPVRLVFQCPHAALEYICPVALSFGNPLPVWPDCMTMCLGQGGNLSALLHLTALCLNVSHAGYSL